MTAAANRLAAASVVPADDDRPPEWTSPYADKSVHLIGIGGCGMYGLAGVMLKCGARVSGSDRQLSAGVQQLMEKGVRVHIGHATEHLPNPCDLVVHSAAVPDDNPELVEARRRGVTTTKYAEMLGNVMRLRSGLAVAGTHGKSTTTALLAYILREAGRDPTFVVGAGVEQLGGSSGVGNGRHFVAEACEFDRSFLNMTPDRAAILNIEEDHLDCYSDLDAIIDVFRSFAAQVPSDGLIVANGDDAAVTSALAGARAAVETFGFSPDNTWAAVNLTHETGRYRFDILHEGKPFAHAALNHLSGVHHVANALAATAMAWSTGVTREAILHGLSGFRGAQRRMSVRGQGRGVTVIDDYGHHPTEVAVTLQAIRETYPGRRLWLVFQPHQHSRTRFLMDDFARCFGQADRVLVPDIYFVRDSEAERQAVSSRDLVARICGAGGDAVYLPSFDAIVGYLLTETRPNDVVVTMGAGDVWKIADELVRRL